MKTILSVMIFTLTTSSYGSTLKLTPEHGQISFIAKGKPAFISIKGNGQGVSGFLEQTDKSLNGQLQFSLNTLNSGIELRDEHLKKKYLEVDKFPMASLKIIDLKLPDNPSEQFAFSGQLNLHGVEQKVDGRASIEKNAHQEVIKAEFSIQLTNFKIDIPSFQGITVAEEIKINVELPVTKQE